MASANQMKATFISQKLKFLKDRGDHLISDVGLYVTRIITAGESWAEGGDNKLEYLELCHMIDAAVEFLCEKCEELAGGSMAAAANQLSQGSRKQPGQTSQPTTASASTSAASNKQPAVPVQPADEYQLRLVSARITAIEDALCSISCNAEKVAAQQSGIDQQLKELFCKLSESDKKHSSRARKVKEQISEISDSCEAIHQEHRTKLHSLEKQLLKLSTAQDRLEAEMESQTELLEKYDNLPDRLESVIEKIDVLDARIDKIIDDCSNKHEDIKTVTDDLADKVVANTQSVQLRILCQMLNDRLTPLEQLRASLNERANMRDENIKKLSQVIKEVSFMSPRLQQLELKSSRTGCGFSAQTCFSEEVAGNTIKEYTIKHSTVGDKFNADTGIFTAPVDGLYVASISIYLWEKGGLQVGVRYQRGLSQTYSLVCDTSAMAKRTTACSLGVVSMKAELISSGTGCGFSAQRWLLYGEIIENHIQQYKINYSNVGDNFNADSGTFTAPADGLYVASISLCLLGNEPLHVGVRYQQRLGHICTYVCESSAVMRGATSCGMGIVGMYSGDKLFSCVIETDKNECDKMIYFSCFLVR